MILYYDNKAFFQCCNEDTVNTKAFTKYCYIKNKRPHCKQCRLYRLIAVERLESSACDIKEMELHAGTFIILEREEPL